MNQQDFICKCSDLMWGGELGWDEPGGLQRLYEAIQERVFASIEESKKSYTGVYIRGSFKGIVGHGSVHYMTVKSDRPIPFELNDIVTIEKGE